jgi:hypothetical protein
MPTSSKDLGGKPLPKDTRLYDNKQINQRNDTNLLRHHHATKPAHTTRQRALKKAEKLKNISVANARFVNKARETRTS